MVKKVDENLIRNQIINDIDYSMFIEAGAGAGKTTILVSRILKQLKSGYKPEEIVAITFTKKAAEEMKTRMIKRLRDERESVGISESEKKSIVNAIKNFDKMQISTIHSFCFKMLMEQALNAKLRLDLAMLEEDEKDFSKEEFFNDWYKNLKYTEYKKLRDLNVKKVKEVCLSAFKILTDLSDDVIIELDDDLLNKGISAFPIKYKKDDNGDYKLNDYGEKKEEKYDDRDAFIANYIINLMKEPAKKYKSKSDSHYISNDMLLIKTRDLLTGSSDYNKRALNYFRSKYKCIYIDEFQDTSKVQVDLMYALTSDEDGALREGALFVVGDPKQSIYRFRGADVPLYNAVKNTFNELAKDEKNKVRVFELNYNFRTNNEVLEFINRNSFDILENYKYMESKSNNNVASDENVINGVYHIGSPTKLNRGGSKKGPGYNKETDKKYLAGIIRGLIDKKVNIWDKNLGKLRPVEYGDFLVLCKGIGSMDEYMDVLMECGIPVSISSRVSISKDKVFLRIKNVFRYFAYPFDNSSREVMLQVFEDKVITRNDRKASHETFIKLNKSIVGLDAFSKLNFLSHNLDIFFDNGINLSKDDIKIIQTQIVQMVETIINTRSNNEMDVYDGICEFIENGYEREMTQEAESNSVRFMNLHKSKGLEGKIVIVCKRSEQRDILYDTYHYNDENGDEHYYLSVENITNSFSTEKISSYKNKEDICKKAEKEEMDEYDRLAYVEATRAEEVLIFMNPLRSAHKTLFGNYKFDSAKDLFVEIPELKYYVETDDIFTKNIKSKKYKGNEFILKKSDEQKLLPYNRITPSLLAKEDDVDVVEDSNKPEVYGPVYGTIMHRTFEFIVNDIFNKKTVDEDRIKIIINIALAESYEAISEFVTDKEKKKQLIHILKS